MALLTTLEMDKTYKSLWQVVEDYLSHDLVIKQVYNIKDIRLMKFAKLKL